MKKTKNLRVEGGEEKIEEEHISGFKSLVMF